MKKRILTGLLILIVLISINTMSFGSSKNALIDAHHKMFGVQYEWKDYHDISNIITISFVKNTVVPKNAVDNWDVSKNNDGRIVLWIIPNSDYSGMYDMFIGSKENIIIENAKELFAGYSNCIAINNINYLDFSNATDMSKMFYRCENLETINLTGIDTSNVIDMSGMFHGCERLKEIDFSGFNTSKVNNMTEMFRNCRCIETIDLKSFDTSNVTKLMWMFMECNSLKTIDLSNFNTIKVTDMSLMFNMCTSLESINLSYFNTRNVINMESMFSGCRSLKVIDLTSFDTSNVTSMSGMFSVSGVEKLDLKNFNTKNVNNMQSMFNQCTNLKEINLTSFDTSNVTNMSFMFNSCVHLKEIDLRSFNTSNVTTMRKMFSECSDLKELNLSSFDTSNVTDMSYMFQQCNSLTDINLSNFDTKKVTTMKEMFISCGNLGKLDLSSFSTSKVTDMSYMFQLCSSLKDLNISEFDTQNLVNVVGIFTGCKDMKVICRSEKDLEKLVKPNTIDFYAGNFNINFIIKNNDQNNNNAWRSASDWAIAELDKANDLGIIPSIFSNQDLTQNITRKEFAYIVVKLWEKISGQTIVAGSKNPFIDTEDQEVLKAYNLEITKGTSDTTFSPDELITREQMATMMTRALLKAGINTSVDLEKATKFADDSEMHEWGKESIYYMSGIGIIKGIGNNTFNVLGNATREQALLISERSAEKFVK